VSRAWIKSLGTAKSPIQRQGLTEIEWITSDIGFPVNPNVRLNDKLVLYASGLGKIFGVVEVTGQPELDNRAAPWSYRVRTRPLLVIEDLARAPALEDANVDRNLRKSIRQQSHIRLRDAEYDAAVAALRAAADPAAGDIVRPMLGGRW
jgi:hypothetical protein